MTQSVADYGDFKFFLNPEGMSSKDLKSEANKITLEATRRQKMFENGILSKVAYKDYEAQQTLNLSRLYAKYIIVGWEGKLRDKDLGKYDIEACAKVLADESALFIDLIEVAKALAEKQNEIDEAEIKN